MIINNLNLIKPLLKFESNDIFYHLQILKRKKDCAEHDKGKNNNARCIKTYYITSVDYLDSHMNEIIKLCQIFNARAYINLNAKSFEKVSFELNAQLADRLKFKQFNYCYRLYETVVGGGYSSEDEFDKVLTDKEKEIISSRVNVGEKRWIIDIDEKEISPLMLAYIEYNCFPISKWEYDFNNIPTIFNSKIIIKIPTKNGWHLITKPFNLQQFKQQYSDVDIQKNNPTLLYFEYED